MLATTKDKFTIDKSDLNNPVLVYTEDDPNFTLAPTTVSVALVNENADSNYYPVTVTPFKACTPQEIKQVVTLGNAQMAVITDPWPTQITYTLATLRSQS